MDAAQFDTLTRALSVPGSRRRALVAALSCALGLLGVAPRDEALAAKSGRCKATCGECETCRRGDCKRKNGKKRCKPGRCKAKDDGTPCGTGGQTCQGGTCSCPGATELCAGTCVPVCGAGSLRPPSTCGCCDDIGQSCELTNAGACCSAACSGAAPNSVCRGRFNGDPCQFNAQCASGNCADTECAPAP